MASAGSTSTGGNLSAGGAGSGAGGASPIAAGGASSSGGASSGAGAGSGGENASGASGSPSSPPPESVYEMIDDLEDNDARILMGKGRQGPWHIFNNQGNGGNQQPSPFAPEKGGAKDTMFAVHTSGEGFEFAGVGFDLNNAEMTAESAKSQAYDASIWDGITFWAKGTGSLRVEIPTRNFVPRDRGGSCTNDCWNVYGLDLPGGLAAEWREYRIPFAMLKRESGSTTPSFARAQLMSVSFRHQGNARFDFWIDEVRLYDEPRPGAANMCTFEPERDENGSFTWYHFGQGGTKEGENYRTACGYVGHGADGSDGKDNKVDNIAEAGYFAAVPSESKEDFDSKEYCGACAEIANGERRVVVTIVDACPDSACKANRAGHLNLSVPAFDALQFNTGNPNKTSWRFVPCPVKGNVVVRIAPDDAKQVFIENTLLPIKSVQLDGERATRLNTGAWELASEATGKTLRLTDTNDRVIEVQAGNASGENQMTSQQFPTCMP
jgi:hypothetical protein